MGLMKKAILIVFSAIFALVLIASGIVYLISPAKTPPQAMNPALRDLAVPDAFKTNESMQTAKVYFLTSCAKCHGNFAEGTADAPNLTDKYWMHGQGSFRDIYELVKTGVPGTNMIGLSGKMQDEDIQRIAAYVVAIQGSSPHRAKGPQGQFIH